MTTGVPGLMPALASRPSSESNHANSGRSFGGADGVPPESTVSHLSPIAPRSPQVDSLSVNTVYVHRNSAARAGPPPEPRTATARAGIRRHLLRIVRNHHGP